MCVCVYGDLQRCLSNIPKNDVIIVLGDFNARVGVGTGSADDVWQDVRGRFGVGNCNAAGERLLMWCATNQLSIMNTWFQKPDFRRGTWKHPATKQYHMIDFVLMHRHQRARCHDVAVVRGANCFTDHLWYVRGLPSELLNVEVSGLVTSPARLQWNVCPIRGLVRPSRKISRMVFSQSANQQQQQKGSGTPFVIAYRRHRIECWAPLPTGDIGSSVGPPGTCAI